MKKLLIVSGVLIAIIAAYSFMPGKEDPCPAEGKADPKKGKHAELRPREKNLNKHKNRQSIPQADDFDKIVTIQLMYDSKDDSLWSEEKAASISGYFFRATDNSGEQCNCFTEDKNKLNTNIYICPTPIDKNTRTADCIVVVITPYTRSLKGEWDTDKLNEKLGGKKISISGWLIYDFEHSNRSIETNSNSTQPERRTIWGIYPVTDLKVLN
ncbi:MAG TPA: hypothetical protein VK806_01220 [Bacteroidia bacterium]|nr:hypothetical protein [Bacteroidia bacterium]